jgi:hypothetical protein
MSDDTTIEAKGKKDRSPSFPFIPLEKAIIRAEQLQEKHKNQPARLAVVGVTWGYGPKSSGLLQTAAALKQYGLVEDIGGGADRKLVLTDLARRILLDKRLGAREQALKEAALKPRLIAEYAPIWLGNELSPDHCLSELRLDRGFTEAAAESFLKVFNETADFANLQKDDSLSPTELEGSILSPPASEADGNPLLNAMTQQRTAQTTGPKMRRSTLALQEGMAAVELPSPLSKESQSKLAKWLELMVEFADVAPEEPTGETS